MLEQAFGWRMLLSESQRTVLEVILTDSWKDVKRDCTTVLEAGGIKGLKIWLGNALHSTRNFSGRNLVQGQILSFLS